jgi:alpha-galactosidase
MLKVTLLGAGSGFCQPLFTDILSIEGIDDRGVIGLVDIDSARLGINIKLLKRVLELKGKSGWTIEASTDRRTVLPGSDYVINTIEVSGVHTVRYDNDIPLKYGIDQCIGDTIGPGGVMKALRTVPVWLQILQDVRALCPKAMVLNYTNPMSIMSLASVRSLDGQPFVGLCHSVQGTTKMIARWLDVPYEEFVYRCGGINHMAWLTELTHKGRDLYPKLKKMAQDPEFLKRDPVRLEMMQQFGYFVTESSGHFSEYVPYFRKRKDLIKKHCGDGYNGLSSFYADSWPSWRKSTDAKRKAMAEGKMDIPLGRGHEYASDIIEGHRLGRQKTIYASVANTGLIPNLPLTGVVEVATTVDRTGFNPTWFGPLPEQVAALCRSNMAVFELTVDGILNKNRESIVHAMMVDPLSSAVCSPAEIRAMADDLFAAEKKYVPSWCQAKASRTPAKKKSVVKKAA